MTIDEVENLIKKHEAFEKSASAQEERFMALERLTTVSNSLMYGFRLQIHIVHLRFMLKILYLYEQCLMSQLL